MLERKQIECDLCVVGGGMAGLCAAVSAAREGLDVVLVHERPVLGGNASSEIRMWICGAHGENNRETGILEEIALENLYRNPTKSYPIWDSVLYDIVKREENITLLLNTTCMDGCAEQGEYKYGRSVRAKSITAYQMTTQCFYEISAKYFCDSSGDSILAPIFGAEFRIGREAREEFDEGTAISEADDMTMGMSCLIQGRETDKKVEFIPPTWSTPLTAKNFENRNPDIYSDIENFWYLELGGDRDTIADTELLRDELVPLAMGTWDHIKNSGDFKSENWDLEFLGFLPGKRESRRLIGEYIVTQKDISANRVYEDEIAYGGWPLDDHFPGGFYHRGAPNTYFPTPAPYSIPYRALYSKNVENLFFAGRNISMTHAAMSSMRVMATCSLLGEAVGKAVSIAVKKGICPHEVYLNELEMLQSELMNEDCFLPSKTRRISELCKTAKLSASNDVLRNGQDRVHAIYDTDENSGEYYAKKNERISYGFTKQHVAYAHIVFDSDLDRKTLPGSDCERTHSTRANIRLDSPQMHMPYTLCKSFKLIGLCGEDEYELLSVENNRKRSYHIVIDRELDGLVLVPETAWGEREDIPVISFDFE